jgi:D-threo-aldose 1-dehydrogenase
VLLPACQRRRISVIVGGPFNSGILASAPRPGSRYDYAEAAPEVLDRARRLHEVCHRHGVPLGAAALQLPLLHPAVASVIPGARSPREVEQHAAWLRWPIPHALWDELKAARLLDPRTPTDAA